MTLEAYEEEIRRIEKSAGILGIHVSPDFQCDQTGGFPCSLCVCWEKGKAWLQLNESMIMDGQDVSEYERYCADFGFRPCWDEDDFNHLLQELGEDAVQSAELDSEQNITLGGM